MEKNFEKRLITSLVLFLLIFLIFKMNFFFIYTLLILSVISLIEFIKILKKIFYKKNLYVFIISLIFIIYLFFFCFFFYQLSNLFQLKILLLILLLTCVSSDIGGFIFGKIFKGPKLTKISPKKTISGAAGSLVLASIIFSTFIFLYTGSINLNIFFIGLITSVGCQFGDLFFSFLKRKAKMKDTGNFFPGHGGVLDRLDSILIGLPVGYITFILIY